MLESTKRLPKIQLVLFSILVCLFSCEHNTNNASDQTTYFHNHQYDSLSYEKQIEEVNDDETVNRDSINDFLDNPFDYHAFKRGKKMSNSGGSRKETYYFKPNKEGMYYSYFLFSNCEGYLGTNKERVVRREDALEITVYKELGKYKYEYEDPTEILIEVKATLNDFDLPELAFVGLDSSTIIKSFGSPDLIKNNCVVYKHNNKALVLSFVNKKVKRLKYLVMKEGAGFNDVCEI